ncbi:MAG: MarR family transcriptional regulator [Oxalobacteraceae bacterium]|nr:MAG: MarR family transcriptional regulator [Oxalobacteraceae bacterium]
MPRSKAAAKLEPEPLETLAKFRIIIRAAQRHSAAIQKQCGVSGAQLWILQEISEAPGLRVGELAARMAIHQTTTSNLLDALEKRGYLKKSRDEADQRVVNLLLTPSGSRILRKAPSPARGLLPEALARVDPKKRAQLDAGLQALLDVIEGADSGAGAQPLPFTL